MTPPGADAPTAASQESPPKAVRKSFCFIATAAYGSPLAPEVLRLQRFRDAHLRRTRLGRDCIRLYYRLSPILAGYIAPREKLKSLVRALLSPLIRLVKYTFPDGKP